MANNDADWVEDVRRWCLAGSPAAPDKALTPPAEPEPTDFAALGYEAAHPALQARNWPEAPVSNFIGLR
ncbi:MAG: hypothetical protein ABI671_10540 [Burkholderiales bacterium]